MTFNESGFWYHWPKPRAVDVPPRKDIFEWIKNTYPDKVFYTCDSGGSYIHTDYGINYIEKCRNPAVYRYTHLGEDRKHWKDFYRCEEHSISARDNLLKEAING